MTRQPVGIEGFGVCLARAMAQASPLCVGVDPSPALLNAWGLADDPTGLRVFCDQVIDSVAGVVAAVKPQSAFFERHGSAGIGVLEHLCANGRARGLLVLLDVKRGDIGSTCEAYADAYLRADSAFAVDAITASPYLGVPALRPLVEAACSSGRGVFVVARSSNPEGASIQHALAAGRTVVNQVLSDVAVLNSEVAGERPGTVGVVVGATVDAAGYDLAGCGGPILVPGLGAQGASVADIAARFTGLPGRVLPTASRSVLRAGPSPDALRAAASVLADECRAALAA